MRLKWHWKELVKLSKKNYIIPVFVPHFGCKNDCVFCNQRKITGFVDRLDSIEYVGHIEDYLKTIGDPQDKHIEIAFFGGSFTGLDISIQMEYLEIAKKYKDEGKIDSIRLSTRPDYIDKEILDFLKSFGVDIIELGVQSLDEEVLKISKRGHDRKDVEKASELIKDNGFVLGIQIMVGLPGDNEEKYKKTVESVINLKPNIVRIYPVLVIKKTELENMYKSGEYTPVSLNSAIKLSAYGDKKFYLNGIKVIRIGLQATKNISKDFDLIAGPFHPSFRQYVDNYHFLRSFMKILDELKEIKKEIRIRINPRDLSNAIGLNKVNKQLITEKYGEVCFRPEEELKEGKFEIIIDEKVIKSDKYKY